MEEKIIREFVNYFEIMMDCESDVDGVLSTHSYAPFGNKEAFKGTDDCPACAMPSYSV
jgi:hypothetical protein